MNINSIQAMGLEYVIFAIGILLGRKCFKFIKKGMNYFWRFMVVLNFTLLINIPRRLFELGLCKFSLPVIYWIYSIGLVLLTFSMYYWFLFILKLLDCKFINSRLRIHLSMIPAFMIIVLCIINRWTGWLYYIDNETYFRGSHFILQGIISYTYLAVIVAYILYCIINNKNKEYAKFGLYSLLPVFAGIIMQVKFDGSFILSGIVICASIMYIDICLEKQKNAEMKEMKEMLVQTAETLASAIDAKDEYTHGHSTRVAQYSRKIAEMAGYSEDQVDSVYFSGLLHDVGKIGIPDEIINKKGRLTDEEFNIVKQHSMKGREILSHIRKMPFLTMGAKYHHERYDGLGYPEALKATDIPWISRIIAVADAYDAMTSNRSYRNSLSQEIVREEIRKGAGKQFDPVYAELFLKLIDKDKDFKMRQNDNPNELYCLDNFKNFYEGYIISPFEMKIHFHSEKIEDGSDNIPTIVLYDAVDSRIHIEEQEKQFYLYTDYCDIRIDGKYKNNKARKMEISVEEKKPRNGKKDNQLDVEVTVVKSMDHIIVNSFDGYTSVTATVVLPDSSRFAYIGITGEMCVITNLTVETASEPTPSSKIKRIAEEITYFDKPDGDIPNLQVDIWRVKATKGIPLNNEMKISFFMKSLPFARLIWHCPYIVLFDSDDKKVYGNNYREYGFIRLDGESWQEDKNSKNYLKINKTDEFKDWETWKRENKKGRQIEIYLKRVNNQIFCKTSCGGIELDNVTTIETEFKEVYVSLSGDQVLMENFKIEEL